MFFMQNREIEFFSDTFCLSRGIYIEALFEKQKNKASERGEL